MGRKDTFHDQVRDALVADGWTITHDPYRIVIGSRKAFVDLGAEMPIGAEKDGRRIAVEVKSFVGASPLDDLEDALGQFGVYRVILSMRDPARTLYLAVPDDIRDFVEEQDIRKVLRALEVRLIIFSTEGEEPLEWIEPTSFEKS